MLPPSTPENLASVAPENDWAQLANDGLLALVGGTPHTTNCFLSLSNAPKKWSIELWGRSIRLDQGV